MQFRTLLPILVVLSQSATLTALAQAETKPVQVRTFEGEVEEYSVLATDKKVRQGPYVRYRAASIAGLVVFEAGNYDHGLKEGEWSQFAKDRPWNSLLSKGTFHNGLPDGLWTYYHYKHLSGGPFNRAGTPTAQATANGPGPKAGYSVNIADTAAVVQAQGLYARGVRVGMWVYYDRKGQVTQKIDHFSKQLIYWRPETGVAISGEAAATHPVMYLGGKSRLTDEIWQLLNYALLIRSSDTNDNGVVEVAFAIDTSGQLASMSLVGAEKPTRYQKLMLATLSKVPPNWLPQAKDGKPVAAEYKVRITTIAKKIGERTQLLTTVDALGD